jgi:hypothetical protein
MITYGPEVANELLGAVPELAPAYEQHLADNDGELLLHVLFGDLTRFVVAAQAGKDDALVTRSLSFVERLLVEGDEGTKNLVAVSFVENLAWEADAGSDQVRQRFPPHLAAELRAQREWRPR